MGWGQGVMWDVEGVGEGGAEVCSGRSLLKIRLPVALRGSIRVSLHPHPLLDNLAASTVPKGTQLPVIMTPESLLKTLSRSDVPFWKKRRKMLQETMA